ncbi:MAG TPA: hypothetical protein ENN87_14170 [Phycisphaerales bacterium]|nr:hypothetical protein [Phycisphaerales bacterium]
MFRFLYVTDLHGWTWGYDRTLEAAREEGIGVIVNGGDLFPHARDLIAAQRLFIDEYLEAYVDMAQEYGIAYYAMPANDDCKAVLPAWRTLVDRTPCLHDPTDGWAIVEDGLRIRGCNYIPDPPFRLKDWCVLDTRDFVRPPQPPQPLISEGGDFEPIEDVESFFRDRPTLEEILDGLSEGIDAMDRAILVCHAPPAGMGLAAVPEGMDVGSQAVRSWILSRHPLCTLHGHIHESHLITRRHTVRIGRTVCHQPGQERFMGRLVYSIVSVDGQEVTIERRYEAAGSP